MYSHSKVPGIVVTGIHEINEVRRKIDNDSIVKSSVKDLRVIGPQHTLIAPLLSAITVNVPRTFIYDGVALSSGTAYIRGTVFPVESIVNISIYTEPNDNWFAELEANRIAQVKSDEKGAFSIDLTGVGKYAVVWSEVPSTIDAMNSKVRATAVNQIDGKYVIETFCTCGEYISSGGTPTFTISGSCPTDATQIYISTIPAKTDAHIYLEALTNNTLYSAIPSDGTYSVSFSQPISQNKVIVWCLSDTLNARITATYTVDEGDIQVCLAGETPILLYDGTQKALHSLTVDDVLMAGDYTPTRICKITRGIVSDYHTLYLFDDGTIIDEAHRHRFYNVDAGYWMYLDEWKIGDRAKNYDGNTPKLIRIERVDEPCRRYGLWTESHDYYANNLLSGETAANQTVLANATLEQAVDMLATVDADKLDKLYKGVFG